MNKHSKQAAKILAGVADKEMDKTFGARYRNNGYMQPLHHHSYSANHKAHTRDKIRGMK